MLLYVAVQRGVYRHNIEGVSDDLEFVKACGRRSIEEEHDHYHDIEIIAFGPPLLQETDICTLRWDKATASVKEIPA